MKAADKYKVFVVIVTFNGISWLQRCLSSLEKSTVLPEVVIIDNGSDDGSQDFIKSKFSGMTLIQAEHNLGFGRANNIGIELALGRGAEFVFLLNQDAWIEPGTIENLIAISEKNSAFGIISPMQLNGDYSAIDFNFSNYIVPGLCPDLYSDVYIGKLKKIYEVPFVNAAAWLISAACIKTVGYFDSLFFHYGEDRNYSQRALYHGFKIGVCPGERIAHDRIGRKGVLSGFDGRSQRQRMMLVELADVNRTDTRKYYSKLVIKSLMNVFIGVLKFDKEMISGNLSDYRFLKSNIRATRDSVEKNRKALHNL